MPELKTPHYEESWGTEIKSHASLNLALYVSNSDNLPKEECVMPLYRRLCGPQSMS